ncbi:pantoate--beta-alanine ligase, partial [bacterium]|nr:pantoate--beta-alanine ligase [bacterium]
MALKLLTTIDEASRYSTQLRDSGFAVGLVPTMGALHEGHLSLVRLAQRVADRVIVSIFVNPTQFGAGEDLEKYPRDLERDLDLLRKEGVRVVFHPAVEDMYVEEFATAVRVEGSLTRVLCGARRQGHFNGVATVVTKLFTILRPHLAVFGQKDYQQFLVIRR